MTRPFIPFYEGCQVRLIYGDLAHTPTLSNLLHFWTPAGFGGSALYALVQYLAAWDRDYWSYCRHQGLWLTTIDSIALDVPNGAQYTLALEDSQPGHMGGALHDWAATKAVTLETAYRGRSQQGIIFAPPLPAGVLNTPTQITRAYGIALLDAVEHMRQGVQHLNPAMELVVASFRTNKQWRTEAAWTIVDHAVLVNYRIDTLRRRLKGWG